MSELLPHLTPKRKRDEEGVPPSPILTHTQFSFQLPVVSGEKDGSASPRTNVAHKFRGLALEGGGGVTEQRPHSGSPERAPDGVDEDEDPVTHKRQKSDTTMHGLDDIQPAVGTTDLNGKTIAQPVLDHVLAEGTDDRISVVSEPRQSFAALDRQAQINFKARKRAAMTLATARKNKTGDAVATREEREIVDPVRASLTWHDDEITVYDPNDEDDDGTGINGIGFRPTAALAYARTQRRKQQLAEYRKREESDARARRSQRRQGSSSALAKLDSTDSGNGRRVRFLESEPTPVITTG